MGERWVLADPGSLANGRQLQLGPAEGRHVTTVLRLGPGDDIVLTDGRGTLATAVIEEAGKRGVTVSITRVTHVPKTSPGIGVALGVLHSQAMDWAVAKAVETGAERFIPVLTARSQGSEAVARRRLGHWRRAARQAIKQCHRAWEMSVEDPLGVGDLISSVPPGSGLVADREGRVAWELEAGLGTVLLVGPEGGLTGTELTTLDRAGWRRLTLGPHVLRAETAVATGTAMLSLAAAWKG